MLGGRREYWGTHRPGVEVGASAGVFSSEGARCPPSPGHLRGRGLGAWRDRRGGGPLKYLLSFPPAELEGHPVLSCQTLGAAQAGGPEGSTLGRGEGRGGAKPGEHQTLENMPSSKAFLLISKPHH